MVSPLHALRPHCVSPCLLFILDRQRKLTVIHKYIVPHTLLFHCTGHNFGRLTCASPQWNRPQCEHVTTPWRHHKHGYHRYLWDFLHHIYSGDNWCGGWQLMWPFRFVAVPVCGRFGLWPFRPVAVPVCGRSGLWPFRFVAVPVCGRFGLWPFRFVAVSVCGRFGCGRFGLWPLWPVTHKIMYIDSLCLSYAISDLSQPFVGLGLGLMN